MNGQLKALKAELIKIKYSPIVWVTFTAFGIAPIMGGVFMLMMRNPDAMAKASGLNAKMNMMNISADWNSYFGILTQSVGVGGVMVFGFVASWIFGREYSDGTAKDLLSLPTSRAKILNAKFVVYAAWCFLLVISNLLIGLVIAVSLGFEPTGIDIVLSFLKEYFTTTILTIPLGTLIAFFAIWGKGYLAPLGFVALTLVFAQVIAAAGYGYYFPWSIPGIFSVAVGDYKERLDIVSYGILVFTSMAGYFSTILYWRHWDQAT